MIHAILAVPAGAFAGLGSWLNAVRTALTAPIVLRYFL